MWKAVFVATTLVACSPVSTRADSPQGPTPKAPERAEAIAQAPADITAAAADSVLVVRTDAGMGAGFILSETVAVTSLHVLRSATEVQFQAKDGSTHDAVTVTGWSADNDLAFVRVAPPFSQAPLTLAVTKPVLGESIVVIGHPLGLEETVSTGVVSGIRREGEVDLLQISAAISRGSSGGPVLNDRAEVIGIVRLFLKDGQALNFATPTAAILTLLREEPTDVPVALLTEMIAQDSHQTDSAQRDSIQDQEHSNTGAATDAADPAEQTVLVMHDWKLELRTVPASLVNDTLRRGYHVASPSEIARYRAAAEFPNHVAGFAFDWNLAQVQLACGGRRSTFGDHVEGSDLEKVSATIWTCPYVPSPPGFVTSDKVLLEVVTERIVSLGLLVDRAKAWQMLTSKYGAPWWGCVADCKGRLDHYTEGAKYTSVMWMLRGGRVALPLDKANDALLLFIANAYWETQTSGF